MTWLTLIPRRAMRGIDPFTAMQREINRLFDDTVGGLPNGPSAVAASTLRLDVKEDEKAFTVTADLPGLSEKEVEVTFDDGVLTIRGEKKVEREEKSDTWHIVERSSGSFARQLGLPANIDADKIDAKVEKGVLMVHLPKLPDEKASSRKIDVKGT